MHNPAFQRRDYDALSRFPLAIHRPCLARRFNAGTTGFIFYSGVLTPD